MSAVEDSLETQARIGALRCEGGPHSPTGHLLRQLADEIERLRELLREARSYVVDDHGWDYEKGGWLADRIDAALAEPRAKQEKEGS